MPHEILSHQYIFQRLDAEDSEDSDNSADSNAILAAMKSAKKKDPEFTKNEFIAEPIVHNFQHDVESIWWIALWTLTSRVGYHPAKEYANTVFQTTLDLSATRSHAFISTDTPFQEKLNEVFLPSLSELTPWIVPMRRQLLHHYKKRAHKSKLFVKGSYGSFHTSFQKIFTSNVLKGMGSGWQSTELVIQTQPSGDQEYENPSRKKSKTESGQRMQTRASGNS